MTKDDKKFISGLITGLRNEMQNMQSGLHDEMQGMQSGLEEQIRHNGVLIEDLHDSVAAIAQNVKTFSADMVSVKTDIADIKEIIADYPILRATVKKHSRQLAKLS